MSHGKFLPSEPPARRMLIEASAGTGKTHALTGLTVTLLGRGPTTVDQLVIVTYTRAATAELRARIRLTLARVHDALTGKGETTPDIAELVEVLSGHGDAAVQRLQAALADFGSLSISTIHGFAQRTLAALGLSAGLDPDFSIAGDNTPTLTDCVTDAYAAAAEWLGRASAGDPDSDASALLPRMDKVLDAAKRLSGSPDLVLAPESALDDLAALADAADEGDEAAVTPAQLAVTLAHRAVTRATEARFASGALAFDDLLVRLRDLVGPDADPTVRERLRKRFRVGLIDEFQDTDGVQWDVFDAVFGREDGSHLILVGDPKQAIYRFRGADVGTYVRVAKLPGIVHRSLPVNWRSDAPLLTGLDALFTGTTFGPDVTFERVSASPDHETSAIDRDDGRAVPPVLLAFAHTDGLDASGVARSSRKTKGRATLPSGAATEVIHRWVTGHLVDLFEHGRITEDGTPRRIRPQDVALLARSNSVGAELERALTAVGIPAVFRRSDDVRLASSGGSWGDGPVPSTAARSWRTLLDAVADPTDLRKVRAAATGCFGPLSAPTDLIGVDESVIESFVDDLVRWAGELARFGPGAFGGRVLAESRVVETVLAGPDGDRLMTDLEHVAELFSVLAPSRGVAPDRLIEVLDVEATPATGDDTVLARRMPSDDAAVTIMTAHRAKGLQFPVVGCIGLHKSPAGGDPHYFDPDRGVDVWDLAIDDAHKKLAQIETGNEDLRLLYVALTRARHHVFTVWAHERDSHRGALTRVLFARDPATGAIDEGLFSQPEVVPPSADEALAGVASLAARADGCLAVEVLRSLPQQRTWRPESDDAPPAGAGTPTVRVVGRPLDRSDGRWSFTRITRFQTHDESGTATPGEDEGSGDAGPLGPTPVPAPTPAESGVHPLADLPAGTEFGTFVHRVLEQIDFTAPDRPAEIGRAVTALRGNRTVALTPVRPASDRGGDRTGEQLLVDGLDAVLQAPLGPLWHGRRLCDLARRDRLSECDFDLRFTPGATPPVSVKAIGELACAHLAPDDPYRSWAEHLAASGTDVRLGGHLTGSIDLVARVAGPDGGPRFVVADYKTNRLHARGGDPTPDDYAPAALVAAMVEHDYPLQALLYSVALHRYLRWRLPDYDPRRHLGGVTYLFVRGMAPHPDGSDGTGPSGVATWRLPPSLVTAVDACFAGREVTS